MAELYDPYVPKIQHGTGGNEKTQSVQQQMNNVKNIMQQNIDKAMERDERLADIHGKTENLQSTAERFRRGANQVRKRMWWKDLKWKVIIAVTILVILGVIIGSIVGMQQNNNNGS
ncbi:synaptobrevin-domain-containing protein [Absidia repens]|uniref:Synaptobrevin-domain-containing protein n=1 Tax=Absidia repens TaxID=90262 RepID=A0A1X2HIL9_9FUNG|nr:synaptobrevin-domain-containing protein [Absidia repens]